MCLLYLKGGQKIPPCTWIHLIDSGGQSEFHDLLPLFVPNTSVVIFVFKLSESLDQKPMVEYYGPDGRPIGEKCESYLTHKEILEHSLKVLKAHKDPCPKILVIGTHKDHSPQKLEIEKLNTCLKPFYGSVFQFGSHPIALINCFSCEDDIKNLLNHIRKEIMTATDNVGYKPTPLAWFYLEIALKTASQSSKPSGILSLQKCKEVAESLPYFKGEAGLFDRALDHLVKNNIFLYFSDILKDIVFCDPQSLLNEVTEIVKQHYKLVNSTYGKVGSVLMFEKHAYISDDILKQILPQFRDKEYILKTEELFKLLTKLNIISKLSRSNYYLMPALLSNIQDPVKKAKEISNEDIPPFCISFEGCAPSGLFCSLVAHILHSEDWKLCMNDNTPKCCYRNCVQFMCHKQTVVTLVDSFSHFMIYIKSPYTTSPYIIKDMVHKTIDEVAKCLSFDAMKYEAAIECPEHPGRHDHVAVWHHTPNEFYVCKKDNSITGHIDQKYHIWSTAKAGTSVYKVIKYIL